MSAILSFLKEEFEGKRIGTVLIADDVTLLIRVLEENEARIKHLEDIIERAKGEYSDSALCCETDIWKILNKVL